MTNIYAVKFQLEGSEREIILNALNQRDAVRKAEEWFTRKFHAALPHFWARPVATMLICGDEKEIVCRPSPERIRPVMVL
jgi:hypothetical protein